MYVEGDEESTFPVSLVPPGTESPLEQSSYAIALSVVRPPYAQWSRQSLASGSGSGSVSRAASPESKPAAMDVDVDVDAASASPSALATEVVTPATGVMVKTEPLVADIDMSAGTKRAAEEEGGRSRKRIRFAD